MANDAKYMIRALALAGRAWGRTSPNPLVGAVIVHRDRVLGEGYHHACGEAHAEVEALRDAEAHGRPVKGATLYVNLEPCCTYGHTPPCTRAIIAAGIGRVVVGALDPNPAHGGRGIRILREAGIEVTTGVERAACEELNLPFFHFISTGKPMVMLKMAMTLDGRIATAAGESKWITGEAARSRVQELRRRADAILVGGETVRRDRPSLTVREPADWPRQPKRFVASRTLTAEALKSYFPEGELPGLVQLDGAAGWEEFLLWLGKQQVNLLLIEGGGELAGAALAAGVVDRVEFHIAPKILGGAGSRPVVGGVDPASLADAMQLERVRVFRLGDDIAVSGYRKRG